MKLCQRTNCLHRPGEPVEGMYCHFSYTGTIPGTGQKRCLFCNALEPSMPVPEHPAIDSTTGNMKGDLM